jgi:hypothetical protein
MYWFGKGFLIIPVIPGSKRPAVKWGPWLANLSVDSVYRYWQQHPGHEVGFIVGDRFIVFDADSAAAVAWLEQMEIDHEVTPALVVKTKRGEHHYFRKDPTVPGRTSFKIVGPNPEDRIDVKTGKTMVVLPPSSGREIVRYEEVGSHPSGFSFAPMDFIERFAPNFGRVDSPAVDSNVQHDKPVANATLKLIATCLSKLDPDMPRQDWFNVAAAMFNGTGGADAAYSMFDTWSSLGDKYKGQRETGGLWRYFKPDHSHPITMATLIRMVIAAGFSWDELLRDAEPFEIELTDAA